MIGKKNGRNFLVKVGLGIFVLGLAVLQFSTSIEAKTKAADTNGSSRISSTTTLTNFINRSGRNNTWAEENYGWCIGENPWGGTPGGFSTSEGRTKIDTAFKDLSAHGVKAVRVWLFADLRTGIKYDAAGKATGFDSQVYPDMQALLDVASANNLKIIPVLFDYYIADGTYADNNLKIGEHPELFTDKIKQSAFLAVFKPFFQRFGNHPSILMWDAMNEPEYVKAATFPQVQTFVNKFIDLVHQTAPGKPVTVGAKDIASAKVWQSKEDVVEFHWYPGMPYPLTTKPSSFGISKPAYAAEIGAKTTQDMNKYLTDAYKNGYYGLLFWGSQDGFLFDTLVYQNWVSSPH